MKTLSQTAAEAEKEYRAAQGLNYSFLAKFFESQDHALLKIKPKSFFEIGHIFEDMVRDAVKGTTFFKERYFVSSAKGKMPDELMTWIETGHDLEPEIKLKGDGTWNLTHKARNSFLTECLDHPGLYPITQQDADMLCIMRDNMLDAEIPDLGGRVGDLLPNAEFQVPVYWEKNGIKKKILIDSVLLWDGATIVFDIKTAANQPTLNQFLNKKYWIQKEHYSEGAEHEYGNVHSFHFLVGFKEDPFLCQPVEIGGDDLSFKYDELCLRASSWIRDDRPQKGFLPPKKHYVKFWN